MTRVASFGLFEAKKTNLQNGTKLVGFEIFENLLSSWPFFKYLEVFIAKHKIFPLLKQSLAFCSSKHLATLGKSCAGSSCMLEKICFGGFFFPPTTSRQPEI